LHNGKWQLVVGNWPNQRSKTEERSQQRQVRWKENLEPQRTQRKTFFVPGRQSSGQGSLSKKRYRAAILPSRAMMKSVPA
jgi:hypothetical protein